MKRGTDVSRQTNPGLLRAADTALRRPCASQGSRAVCLWSQPSVIRGGSDPCPSSRWSLRWKPYPACSPDAERRDSVGSFRTEGYFGRLSLALELVPQDPSQGDVLVRDRNVGHSR